MTKVTVLFTKRNYFGFLYAINRQIKEQIYENDELAEVNYIKPKRHHYSVVDQLEVGNTMSNRSIFQMVKDIYNKQEKVDELTQLSQKGQLDISHYQFSAGDVLRIDTDYFISDGLRLEGINFEEKSSYKKIN